MFCFMNDVVPSAGDGPVFFRAVLYPHRSLSPRGFRRLMMCVGLFSVGIGTLFFLSGAWPIVGFMGVDVALLYWAFKASYRSAHDYETVELTADRLIVEKVDRRHKRRWTFQPAWLRVSMEDPPRHHSQVTLSSHGKSLVVGSFLSPDERLDFAKALREALHRSRQPLLATL